MSRVLVTAVTSEPVSVAEAKAHMRVDASDDDALIGALITAARLEAERITGRAMATQTWDLVLDEFPCANGIIILPLPPAQSITWVKYIDEDGVEQTLSSALYVLDTKSTPARLYPAYDEEWPEVRCQPNAVTIRFVCGYTTAAAAIPAHAKLAINQMVAHWYEHRGEAITGTIVNEAPKVAETILASLRVRL
jgi:uncharacterized phiE125 gp8 family phage protein